MEPGVFDYIEGDDTQWEKEPMERLAADQQLMAYKHTSFWQCMDTLREKHILETLYQNGNAPWVTWE
jgi:glucose-1-phosphate cytidylyltransferase